MRLRTQGFTLIEIAIVLSIIGIVVAGVLIMGSTVFGRAGVASLLSSVKDLAAASRDFKTRYGYFPGDLPNAETSTGIIGICNVGNGNGIVDTTPETDCALEHLLKAGMLSKLDFDSTNNKYVIRSAIAPDVRILLSFNSSTNENVIKVSNLPCEIALEIDRKFDSATNNNTPFLLGLVSGDSSVSTTTPPTIPAGATQTNPIASIANCIPYGAVGGPLNDPVATLLIKY